MLAPRVPRDRSLSFGQMLSMVVTVGVVLYGAAYLLLRWIWT